MALNNGNIANGDGDDQFQRGQDIVMPQPNGEGDERDAYIDA